jgi:hypothetical protein
MAEPQPPTAQAVLADGVSRLIATSRALILSGRTVDLAGLNDRVGHFCAQMLDMDRVQARDMLPQIQEISAQLNALAAALHEGQNP